jgi:uncharacterized protein YyaL (SSP411 family)
MRQGGIFDHIGYGFHRYSTDRHWLLPHFEKMLYDQALLALAYTEANQATGKEEYKLTACQIFDYVLRDLTSADGGFYSAEDADSEGEEGKFYTWSTDELYSILENDEADLFIKVFNLKNEGNYIEETGTDSKGLNIPHLKHPISEITDSLEIKDVDLEKRLEEIRRKLFKTREARVHPFKDDKILTDWNGLLIAAMAKSAAAFDENKYLEAAKKGADFILENMYSNNRLQHRFRDGEAGLTASVDDYAFFIWGLLELYEASFELKYFKWAVDLNKELLHFHWDEQKGGFFFSADDAEEVLVRKKEFYDGAVPSGNSVATLNLIRLARMTGDSSLEAKALEIARFNSKELQQAPQNYTQLITALDFLSDQSCEIVIVGNPASEDTASMLKTVRKLYMPNKVVMLKRIDGKTKDIDLYMGNISAMTARDGRATAYVCKNFECLEPVTDTNKLLKLLQQGR